MRIAVGDGAEQAGQVVDIPRVGEDAFKDLIGQGGE
jgi:hypothetical protein